MKSPQEIVMKALLQGQKIRFPGQMYDIAYLEFEHGKMLVFCYCEEQDMYVPCNLTFDGFVDICNTLSRNELFIIGAQSALTEISRMKASAREAQFKTVED